MQADAIPCRAAGLTKHFGAVRALDGVAFEVGAGTVCGVVGPNGAGKSTLLKLLMGQMAPTAGEVRLLGADPAAMGWEERRRVGYVPQELRLFEYLSGREYVDFVLSLYGARPPAERVRDVAALLEIEGALDRPVGFYSPGMAKKLAFLPLLVARPRVLVLDEPFDGVDTSAVLLLQQCVAALARSGSTVLVSSHLLEVVSSVCGRVLILKDGRIVSDVASPAGGPVAVDALRAEYARQVGEVDVSRALAWL